MHYIGIIVWIVRTAPCCILRHYHPETGLIR